MAGYQTLFLTTAAATAVAATPTAAATTSAAATPASASTAAATEQSISSIFFWHKKLKLQYPTVTARLHAEIA